ncbi:hypothetical protein ONS96_002689 [Cadophora gregata f. sp. sojae]|nr:hypothetical protein ONS96_002689 [Cadophora gregata f. sp. sojae]
MSMNSSQESRATLLGIPQELRDKIITLLVPRVEMPPQLEGDPESREYLDDTPSTRRDRVKYLKATSLPGGIPTLKVNKLLRAQTLTVMRHLKLPGARSYRLDVMMIDGEELWPTWLYVPCLTTRVDELLVTLRDLGPFSRKYGRGFQNGDGGPPWMA